MSEEQKAEEILKDLGIVVAANKDEEIWQRVVDTLKRTIAELEKQLEEIPAQINVNRLLLEYAKTKAPKKLE